MEKVEAPRLQSSKGLLIRVGFCSVFRDVIALRSGDISPLYPHGMPRRSTEPLARVNLFGIKLRLRPARASDVRAPAVLVELRRRLRRRHS